MDPKSDLGTCEPNDVQVANIGVTGSAHVVTANHQQSPHLTSVPVNFLDQLPLAELFRFADLIPTPSPCMLFPSCSLVKTNIPHAGGQTPDARSNRAAAHLHDKVWRGCRDEEGNFRLCCASFCLAFTPLVPLCGSDQTPTTASCPSSASHPEPYTRVGGSKNGPSSPQPG